MNPLRAIIRSVPDGTWFEAQLLELDIAVSSNSLQGIVAEIEHALVMEYFVSKELGKHPFASLVRNAPSSLMGWWIDDGDQSCPTQELNIPDEVLDALASAMHSPDRPVLKARQYSVAA